MGGCVQGLAGGRSVTPFACPVCGAPLDRDAGSLRCVNGHAYDLARQGYVNLLKKNPDTLYQETALFIARRAVYQAGFFAPLTDAIRPFVRPGRVFDAGCGEGSALTALTDGPDAIGMDIEKQAVKMAAGAFKGRWWCVGDLCAIPVPDASIDTLLNILTPANYGEFRRVLRPGGRLIKVVPGEEHLKEIRALAGKEAKHSPLETGALFARHFDVLQTVPVCYTFDCDAFLAQNVFRMTPLTAGLSVPPLSAMAVTVDVTVLIGEKA